MPPLLLTKTLTTRIDQSQRVKDKFAVGDGRRSASARTVRAASESERHESDGDGVRTSSTHYRKVKAPIMVPKRKVSGPNRAWRTSPEEIPLRVENREQNISKEGTQMVLSEGHTPLPGDAKRDDHQVDPRANPSSEDSGSCIKSYQ